MQELGPDMDISGFVFFLKFPWQGRTDSPAVLGIFFPFPHFFALFCTFSKIRKWLNGTFETPLRMAFLMCGGEQDTLVLLHFVLSSWNYLKHSYLRYHFSSTAFAPTKGYTFLHTEKNPHFEHFFAPGGN